MRLRESAAGARRKAECAHDASACLAFAGGYTEPIGATPFFLASSVADVEIMRLLLAAGADPALADRKRRRHALMAAAGVNRKLAESAVTEEQSLEAVKLLLELGADASQSRPMARTLSSDRRIADGTSWSAAVR